MLARSALLFAVCALAAAAPTDKTVTLANGVPATLSASAPSSGAKVQVAQANQGSACPNGGLLTCASPRSSRAFAHAAQTASRRADSLDRSPSARLVSATGPRWLRASSSRSRAPAPSARPASGTRPTRRCRSRPRTRRRSPPSSRRPRATRISSSAGPTESACAGKRWISLTSCAGKSTTRSHSSPDRTPSLSKAPATARSRSSTVRHLPARAAYLTSPDINTCASDQNKAYPTLSTILQVCCTRIDPS